jgi:cytochrome c-type biogenesis protein CcsB
VLTRGLSAGRVPWGNMYEFSTASALAVTGVFLLLLARYDVRWLAVFVVTPVLLTLGLAVTVLYAESAQLQPALQSYWLVIHVVAAVVASGAFTVGAALSVLYIVRERAERHGAGAGVGAGMAAGVGAASRLPSSDVLDRIAYRVHAFSFPIWTFAVIAGAIWAENAWSRYWGWDPKETWAFITWVVYAAYLHARATAGWRGTRAAVIALLGFGCFLFNYFGVNIWITGLHSYAGL